MHELKYLDFLRGDRAHVAAADSVSTEALKLPVTSFTVSMERLHKLALMPVGFTRLIPVHYYLMREAWKRVFGEVPVPIDIETTFKVLSEFMRRPVPALPPRNEAFEEAFYQFFCAEWMVMVSMEGGSRAPLEGILASIVQGSWAAFEVLVADLWENALNVRPRLGLVALDAEPIASDDELTAERKRKAKYPFSLRLLRKWDYNLKEKMGTLLVRGRKWDFSRKNETADAYFKVFGKTNTLKKIFDDPQIRLLSAIRNVFVHNAGMADPEFIELARNHPSVSQISESSPVLLDGSLVRGMYDAVSSCGVELITFIDGWLVANSD